MQPGSDDVSKYSYIKGQSANGLASTTGKAPFEKADLLPKKPPNEA
jgi:hypothetical protein